MPHKCWSCGSKVEKISFGCVRCNSLSSLKSIKEEIRQGNRSLSALESILGSIEDDLRFDLNEIYSVLEYGFRNLIGEARAQTSILESIGEDVAFPISARANDLRIQAETHKKSGQFESAERRFKESLKESDTDFRTYFGLAENYILQEDFDSAKKLFRRSLPYAPNLDGFNYKTISLRMIARIEQCLGNTRCALDILEEAVALSPEYLDVKYDFVNYYMSKVKGLTETTDFGIQNIIWEIIDKYGEQAKRFLEDLTLVDVKYFKLFRNGESVYGGLESLCSAVLKMSEEVVCRNPSLSVLKDTAEFLYEQVEHSKCLVFADEMIERGVFNNNPMIFTTEPRILVVNYLLRLEQDLRKEDIKNIETVRRMALEEAERLTNEDPENCDKIGAAGKMIQSDTAAKWYEEKILPLQDKRVALNKKRQLLISHVQLCQRLYDEVDRLYYSPLSSKHSGLHEIRDKLDAAKKSIENMLRLPPDSSFHQMKSELPKIEIEIKNLDGSLKEINDELEHEKYMYRDKRRTILYKTGTAIENAYESVAEVIVYGLKFLAKHPGMSTLVLLSGSCNTCFLYNQDSVTGDEVFSALVITGLAGVVGLIGEK